MQLSKHRISANGFLGLCFQQQIIIALHMAGSWVGTPTRFILSGSVRSVSQNKFCSRTNFFAFRSYQTKTSKRCKNAQVLLNCLKINKRCRKLDDKGIIEKYLKEKYLKMASPPEFQKQFFHETSEAVTMPSKTAAYIRPAMVELRGNHQIVDAWMNRSVLRLQQLLVKRKVRSIPWSNHKLRPPQRWWLVWLAVSAVILIGWFWSSSSSHFASSCEVLF